MHKRKTFRKALLPLLIAGAAGWNTAVADQPPSPAYATFLQAAAYTCTGTLFDDVPADHWACGFIEEFASLNITSGCDASNYCPEDYVTRAQMAVFFVKGLEETLYDQLDGEGSTLDADLLDGQDSVYYLDWSNFINIPADLLDGDDDTLLTLSCASSEIPKWNGSAWACAVDETGGNGDITSVTAGTGLSGGGASGDVTLSANTTYLQRRVGSTCAAGSSIRAIAADGSVTCETDNNSGGDITSVVAGTGLDGGGDTGDVTLNVEVPLVLSGSVGISISPAGLIRASNSSTYGYGMWGEGKRGGGYFKDSDSSGYIIAGYGDHGIDAHGNIAGGYFKDSDSSGYAHVGVGDYGIQAHGNTAGGYFQDTDSSGLAYVGFGDYGIQAYGNGGGGYFEDADSSGRANVGHGDVGISAYGNTGGGYFKDLNSDNYAYVGYGSYKINGTGSVAFVQNHPENADQVIVYNSPEGDEVATYTRGTAKLVNGEARIPLGETFKWVTNPDIGLTAHLTPIGEPCLLYVESMSTTELRVKGSADCSGNARFSYIVYGLRIGFEDVTVVQKKTREARIPSMASHRKAMEEQPELARYTALSRWAHMEGSDRETVKAGMTRTAALLGKIGEFDPKVHHIDTGETEK